MSRLSRCLVVFAAVALGACSEAPSATGACGEAGCAAPRVCRGEVCALVSCASAADCAAGEGCVDGLCSTASDPCAGVTCGATEGCAKGDCYPLTCADATCATSELCVGGVCTERSCAGVTCAATESCAKGVCFPKNCTSESCAPGMVCDGTCRPPSCVEVSCGAGEACGGGKCYPQDCGGAGACPAQQACAGGACVSVLCLGIRCPDGFSCDGGRCFPPIAAPAWVFPAENQVLPRAEQPFDWSDVASATGYRLTILGYWGGKWAKSGSYDVSASTYSADLRLAPYGFYAGFVSALRGPVVGPAAARAFAVFPTPTPATDLAPTAWSTPSANPPALRWTAPEGTCGYVLTLYRVENGAWTSVATYSGADATTLQLPAALPPGTYYWSLRLGTPAGWSSAVGAGFKI